MVEDVVMDERWGVNESLLQSYRSIFISSESFLLAVGAIIVDRRVLLLAVAAVALILIWFVWFPVVRARHLVVDYYKHPRPPDASPSAPMPELSEHDYVHDCAARRVENRLRGIRTNWRQTRLKIDLFVPIMFSAVWGCFVITSWR